MKRFALVIAMIGLAFANPAFADQAPKSLTVRQKIDMVNTSLKRIAVHRKAQCAPITNRSARKKCNAWFDLMVDGDSFLLKVLKKRIEWDDMPSSLRKQRLSFAVSDETLHNLIKGVAMQLRSIPWAFTRGKRP